MTKALLRPASFTLIVSLLLAPSSPAFALRPQQGAQQEAGLEELKAKLIRVANVANPPTPAAPAQPLQAVPEVLRRATAGAEELRIAALPVTHDIDYRLSGRFLSGRIPAEKDAIHLLSPKAISLSQLTTQWIGVVSVFEELVGAGRGLDTVKKRESVDWADLRAQEVQDQVALLRGARLEHVNFETKGLTPGGLQAGAKGGAPKGKSTPTISDVVEHTTAFVEGAPGASSMQLEGLGAETFGSFPDEARGLMVATHINPKLEAAVLKRHGAKNIDEFLDPEFPVDQLVRRVAELNGVHSGQVDVTILTNDEEDMKALGSLRETYPELKINQIKAGTVAPSVAAVLGVNDGRVRLFLRRSGMTEAVYMTILAGVFTADGSYANFRVVSEEIKSEFNRRYDWNQGVLAQMKTLRPSDWEEIRDGKKLFSSRQVVKPAIGAYTFLTNGRTDLGLPFQVEGVRQGKGLSKVYSLVFASNPRQAGAGFLWGSLDGYRIPSTNAAGLEEKPIIGYLPVLTGKEAQLSQRLLEGVPSAKGEATKLIRGNLGSVQEFDRAFGRLLGLSRGDMEVFVQTFERAVAGQSISVRDRLLGHVRRLAQDPGAPHNLPPVSYFNPARYVYARLQGEAVMRFVSDKLTPVLTALLKESEGRDLSDVRQKAELMKILQDQFGKGRQVQGPFQYEIFYDSLVEKDGERYLTLELLLDGQEDYRKGVVLELQVILSPELPFHYSNPYPLMGGQMMTADKTQTFKTQFYRLGLLDPIHFINQRFPEWKPTPQRDIYESRLQALKDSGEKNKRQFIRPSVRQGNNPRFFEPFIRAYLVDNAPLAYHIVDALASERDYGNQGGVGSVANLASAVVRRGGTGVTASWLLEDPAAAKLAEGRILVYSYEKDHHRIDSVKDVPGFASELVPFLLAYPENLITGWPSANLQDETKFINPPARAEALKAGEQIAQTGVIDDATFAALQETYNGKSVAQGIPNVFGMNWLRNQWLHHVIDSLREQGAPVAPFNRWYIEPDYALDGKPQTVEELTYLTFLSWVGAQAHGYPLGPVVPSYGNVHGASAGNPSLALAGILQYAAQIALLYGEPLPGELLTIARKAPKGSLGIASGAAAYFKDAELKREFVETVQSAGERTDAEENQLRDFVLAQLRKIPADVLKTLKGAEQLLLKEVAQAQKEKRQPRTLEQVAPEVAQKLKSLTDQLDQQINQLPLNQRAAITTHAASGLSAEQLSKAREYGVWVANKSTEFQNIVTKQLEVFYLMSVDPAKAQQELDRMPGALAAWNANPVSSDEIQQAADLYREMYDAAAARAIKAAKTDAEKASLQQAASNPLRPFPWFWQAGIGWSMEDPSGTDWSAYDWVPGAHGRYMFSMRDTMTGQGTDDTLLFPNALTWGLPATVIKMAQAEIERTIHFYHQPSVMNAVGGASEYQAYAAAQGAGLEEFDQLAAQAKSAAGEDPVLKPLVERAAQLLSGPVEPVRINTPSRATVYPHLTWPITFLRWLMDGRKENPAALYERVVSQLVDQAARRAGVQADSLSVKSELKFGGRMDLVSDIQKQVPEFAPPAPDLLDRDYNPDLGAGLEEQVRQAVAALDSPRVDQRLGALKTLRDFEKKGAKIPVIGPALPSYIHVHTTASYPNLPGVFSPAHMVWAAHQAGAYQIWLVDHETTAHIQEGFRAAKIVNDGVKKPLRPVFGVEFKAPVAEQRTDLRAALQRGVAAGNDAWVVGWGVPVDSNGEVPDALNQLVERFQRAKKTRAVEQVSRLRSGLGIHLWPVDAAAVLAPDYNITDRQLAYFSGKAAVGEGADLKKIEVRAAQIRRDVLSKVGNELRFGFPPYEYVVTRLIELGTVPTFTMQVPVPDLDSLAPELRQIGIRAFDLAGIESHHPNAAADIDAVVRLGERNQMPVMGGVDYRGEGAVGWPKAAPWMNSPAVQHSLVEVQSLAGNAGAEESSYAPVVRPVPFKLLNYVYRADDGKVLRPPLLTGDGKTAVVLEESQVLFLDMSKGAQITRVIPANRPESALELKGSAENLQSRWIVVGEPDGLLVIGKGSSQIERIPGLKSPRPKLQLPDGRLLVEERGRKNLLYAVDVEAKQTTLIPWETTTAPLGLPDGRVLAGAPQLSFLDPKTGNIKPAGSVSPTYLLRYDSKQALVAGRDSFWLFDPAARTLGPEIHVKASQLPLVSSGGQVVVPSLNTLVLVDPVAGKVLKTIFGLHSPRTPLELVASGSFLVPEQDGLALVNFNTGHIEGRIPTETPNGLFPLVGLNKILVSSPSGLRILIPATGLEEQAILDRLKRLHYMANEIFELYSRRKPRPTPYELYEFIQAFPFLESFRKLSYPKNAALDFKTKVPAIYWPDSKPAKSDSENRDLNDELALRIAAAPVILRELRGWVSIDGIHSGRIGSQELLTGGHVDMDIAANLLQGYQLDQKQISSLLEKQDILLRLIDSVKVMAGLSAGAEENKTVSEAVELILQKLQAKSGRVDTVHAGSTVLVGKDLSAGQIEGLARSVEIGGWVRVRFEGNVARIFQPLPNFGRRGSSGAEESAAAKWGRAPTIQLHPRPHPDDSVVLQGFNALGDRLWIRLVEKKRGLIPLGFQTVDSNGRSVPEDVQIFRMRLLRKILEDALAPADFQEIWVSGENPNRAGYPDFRNPKTLQLLSSEPVRQALANRKEELQKKPLHGGSAGHLTLSFGIGDSVLLFDTSGDDRSSWVPFSQVTLEDRRGSGTVRLHFSGLRRVEIDRKSVYERKVGSAGAEESARRLLEYLKANRLQWMVSSDNRQIIIQPDPLQEGDGWPAARSLLTAETKKALGIEGMEGQAPSDEAAITLVDSSRAIPLALQAVSALTESVLLQTSMPAVITPLKLVTRDPWKVEVDVDSVRTYFAYLKGMGVKAILAVGTTGEFFAMEPEFRRQAIRILTEEGKKAGLIVFANVTGDFPMDVVYNARAAFDAGADGYVTVPLYYLEKTEEVEPHIQWLKQRLDEFGAKRPLLLYNIPMLHRQKGVNLPEQTVEALSKAGLVAGIKDTSLDFDQTLKYIQTGAVVYNGNPLTAEEGMKAGARGVVSVAASLVKADVDLPAADPAQRPALQAEINQVLPVLVGSFDHIQSGVKRGLALLKVIKEETVADPKRVRPLSTQESDAIFQLYRQGRLGFRPQTGGVETSPNYDQLDSRADTVRQKLKLYNRPETEFLRVGPEGVLFTPAQMADWATKYLAVFVVNATSEGKRFVRIASSVTTPADRFVSETQVMLFEEGQQPSPNYFEDTDGLPVDGFSIVVADEGVRVKPEGPDPVFVGVKALAGAEESTELVRAVADLSKLEDDLDRTRMLDPPEAVQILERAVSSAQARVAELRRGSTGGLEEFSRLLREFSVLPTYLAPVDPAKGAQPRAILVNAENDLRLRHFAQALSLMKAKDNPVELEFRLVIHENNVEQALQELRQANPQAAEEFLRPRIVSYGNEQRPNPEDAQWEALHQLAQVYGYPSGLVMQQSGALKVVSELTPNLAVQLLAYFEAGGLNFVSAEAFERLEAILQAA